MDQSGVSVPLVVDLDGTLLQTDTLYECLFAVARVRPFWLLLHMGSLRWGWSRFKHALAKVAALDVYSLPLNKPLMRYLLAQRRLGRRLILATGADRAIALAVANRCACFDAVMASDGALNLRAASKRDRLVAAFGEKGFDYIGNSWSDLPVWAVARRGLLVNPSGGLLRSSRSLPQLERFGMDQGTGLRSKLSAMRVHHWLKNLLLLAPLLWNHQLYHPELLSNLLWAMACFCLAASGVYIFNDLLDLETDRQHPHKRHRSIASGALPIPDALILMLILWCASGCLAALLPYSFRLCLVSYWVLMLAYSLCLRNVPLVDATALATGYSLRVLAGALVVGSGFSIGQLACSTTLFFGLALLKRFAELVALRDVLGPSGRVRGYRMVQAGRVAVLGFLASCLGCGLLGLFPVAAVVNGERLAVWLVSALLLVWVTHMWLMAWLGKIQSDPLAFALRDPTSRVLGLLTLTVSLASL